MIVLGVNDEELDNVVGAQFIPGAAQGEKTVEHAAP